MNGIAAIILAAGRSRRMGRPKLLLPFAGGTVIGHVVDQALAAGASPVVVVVPAQDPGIAAALAGRAVSLVVNADEQGDMLSSIRCGLRELPADCPAMLVLLGDQPAVTVDLLRALIVAAPAAGIVVPTFGGRRGHPLLIRSRYRDELLSGHDSVGLRGLLAAHPVDVHELPWPDDSVLFDMDVPADYARELLRRQGGSS